MICMEDIGSVLPSLRSGKIVGIATFRGEFCIVACEHGLYRLWWDDTSAQVRTSPESAASPGAKHE